MSEREEGDGWDGPFFPVAKVREFTVFYEDGSGHHVLHHDESGAEGYGRDPEIKALAEAIARQQPRNPGAPMSRHTVKGSARIEWEYPNIYPAKGPRDRLTIALYHTRAASRLMIEFDSGRDGYVLLMDRTVDRGGYSETVAEAQEVGFVPAWNEDDSEEHP